jgi:hypothetical protein
MTPAELRALADDILNADLYRLEEDDDGPRAVETKIDWPWLLAVEAGRLVAGGDVNGPVALDLIGHVRETGWATRSDDPGDYPSNAGGARLPTRYDPDSRPHDLADALEAWLEENAI